ncbi:hypothetical protein CSPX01_00097 [Colletotrichum filicis]|nr:hypothetical protein CSPX01_00097 [Colletotrichum filicis]
MPFATTRRGFTAIEDVVIAKQSELLKSTRTMLSTTISVHYAMRRWPSLSIIYKKFIDSVPAPTAAVSTQSSTSPLNTLQRLAALKRSALIRQAAEYIGQAISIEKRDSAAKQPGPSSSNEAPHTSGYSNAPPSTAVQQKSFNDETVVLPISPAVTEQSFHIDSAEDNNRRRSSRHQTSCKRPPQYNVGPANPPYKKSKRSVARKTGLNDILEKATCLKTVRGFIEVVTSNHWIDPLQLQELRHENQSDYGLLSLISQFADRCENQVGLTKIWHYYALWQMSQLVDRARKVAGRQRVDSAELDKILEHKQCGATDYNRNKLRNQLQLGRRLQKIIGPFTGLLCFIAIGQADIGKSLSFTEGDLNRFHVSLDAYRGLWEAGSRYLDLPHIGTQDADEIREITGLANTAISTR